jgi:hypothetical protein
MAIRRMGDRPAAGADLVEQSRRTLKLTGDDIFFASQIFVISPTPA